MYQTLNGPLFKSMTFREVIGISGATVYVNKVIITIKTSDFRMEITSNDIPFASLYFASIY